MSSALLEAEPYGRHGQASRHRRKQHPKLQGGLGSRQHHQVAVGKSLQSRDGVDHVVFSRHEQFSSGDSDTSNASATSSSPSPSSSSSRALAGRAASDNEALTAAALGHSPALVAHLCWHGRCAFPVHEKRSPAGDRASRSLPPRSRGRTLATFWGDTDSGADDGYISESATDSQAQAAKKKAKRRGLGRAAATLSHLDRVRHLGKRALTSPDFDGSRRTDQPKQSHRTRGVLSDRVTWPSTAGVSRQPMQNVVAKGTSAEPFAAVPLGHLRSSSPVCTVRREGSFPNADAAEPEKVNLHRVNGSSEDFELQAPLEGLLSQEYPLGPQRSQLRSFEGFHRNSPFVLQHAGFFHRPPPPQQGEDLSRLSSNSPWALNDDAAGEQGRRPAGFAHGEPGGHAVEARSPGGRRRPSRESRVAEEGHTVWATSGSDQDVASPPRGRLAGGPSPATGPFTLEKSRDGVVDAGEAVTSSDGGHQLHGHKGAPAKPQWHTSYFNQVGIHDNDSVAPKLPEVQDEVHTKWETGSSSSVTTSENSMMPGSFTKPPPGENCLDSQEDRVDANGKGKSNHCASQGILLAGPMEVHIMFDSEGSSV